MQQEEIKRLGDLAGQKKDHAAQGARYRGSDNDKIGRNLKRERSAKSGKQAKAIEKRIELMEIIEKPINRDLFRIPINPLAPRGMREIVLADVVAGHPFAGFRVGPISLSLPYGSRTAILGLNGSGKSTLIKTIGGELPPLSGRLTIGSDLVVGNLMQEHDNLPRDERIKEFLTRCARLSLQESYALAVKFGFTAAEIDKRIVALSPGGRARLLLAVFTALSANVLLLDEPTPCPTPNWSGDRSIEPSMTGGTGRTCICATARGRRHSSR